MAFKLNKIKTATEQNTTRTRKVAHRSVSYISKTKCRDSHKKCHRCLVHNIINQGFARPHHSTWTQNMRT